MLTTDSSVREKLKRLPEGRTVYQFPGMGPSRAHVFYSNHYLLKVWDRFFDLREILDCYHVRQSVVIFRK